MRGSRAGGDDNLFVKVGSGARDCVGGAVWVGGCAQSHPLQEKSCLPPTMLLLSCKAKETKSASYEVLPSHLADPCYHPSWLCNPFLFLWFMQPPAGEERLVRVLPGQRRHRDRGRLRP